MDGSDSIITLVFLGVAVVLFLRLRSVLGRRTGNERQPYDTFGRSEEAERQDKVISLPQRQGRDIDVPPARPEPQIDVDMLVRQVTDPASTLGGDIKRLIAADPTFEPKAFVDGAKMAYEMVVTSFAEGDRRTLRQLLSTDVYNGFVTAIGEREERHETIDFKFVGIDKAEITEAAVRNGSAQVTIRFVSDLISATRDKDGEVIDGDAMHVSEVIDVWTFAREISARDPNWKLIATESVE